MDSYHTLVYPCRCKHGMRWMIMIITIIIKWRGRMLSLPSNHHPNLLSKSWCFLLFWDDADTHWKKGCIVMSNYKTFQRIWNLLLCPEILIVSFCNHLFDPRVLFFSDMMGSHHCSLIIRHKKLLGYGFLWQARVDKLMSQAVDVDYETWYNNKVHNYA